MNSRLDAVNNTRAATPQESFGGALHEVSSRLEILATLDQLNTRPMRTLSPDLNTFLTTADTDFPTKIESSATRFTHTAAKPASAPDFFATKQTRSSNLHLWWQGVRLISLFALGLAIGWWARSNPQEQIVAERPTTSPESPIAAENVMTLASTLQAPSPAISAATTMAKADVRRDLNRDSKPESSHQDNNTKTPVHVSHGTQRIAPALTRAFEHMQLNNLSGAKTSYEQVLRADPHNVDALIGMATIAMRNGNNQSAETYYTNALEVDPNDAHAQAGLANLRGQADPAIAETQIKLALSHQPESSILHFTLGNLYVRQQRWSEAQLAYFNAHTADPDNPDYLFNLAASLDHMHQPMLALSYYSAALDAGKDRTPGFDPEQVKVRMLELTN